MRILRGFSFLVLLAAISLFAGCHPSVKNEAAEVKHYEGRGIVRSFTPDHRTVEIQHENIGDFMPSMTMSFPVQDPKATADIVAGDAISFRLAASKSSAVVEQMQKIDPSEVHLRPNE